MRIVLNGEPRDVPRPLSVGGLLEILGLDARIVAVEVNRVVVRRAHYHDANLAAGDEVEIVAFVGGG